MSENNHHQWSTSKYRHKRAERLKSKEPEWITAPSGAEFYVRKVGMMPYLVAGKLPRSLSADAGEAWEQKGIGENPNPSQIVTQEDVTEGQRNIALMARVLGEAVVIPKLTNNPQSDDELDPSELDEDDVWYLFRYATGQSGTVQVGGQAMPMGTLQSFPKKPGRRIRTGTSG